MGSALDNDLTIEGDKTVSRRHVEIQMRDDGILVKDLGSTNGTFFQEARIREIYVQPGAEADVAAAWQATLGDGAWIGFRDEAIGMGWFGPDTRDEVRSRIGDIVMAASEPVCVFQRQVDPFQAGMLGHHGSLTPDEALVPFLLIPG